MGALYSGAQYGLKCKGLNLREYAPIRADVRMKAKNAVALWLLDFYKYLFITITLRHGDM